MNGVYGVSLVVGVIGLIIWILWGGFSEANDGRPRRPDDRFGPRGRSVVAALTAFGMGGLSASYGGWPTGAALAAALVAAVVFAVYAFRFEAGEEPESD